MTRLLGGLGSREFLQRYWHKRPLLIRGALPGFRNLIDVEGLFELAARDDCETRLIGREGKRWELEHGPFEPALRHALPERNWTLLVQGLNLFLPAADALMRRFAFVPYARLDDVMVSYAVKGGGVGPHVDSYDVFLLQGEGRRRWRISSQREHVLDEKQPVRILKNFRAEQEWVLEPGDMLYLPPGVPHEGTALEPCMTYSIGFRAPGTQELGVQFLGFMQERLRLSGMYQDPRLQTQADPARLADDFVAQVERMLRGVAWKRADIEAFIGGYLTEPKPQIRFARPRRALEASTFAAAARRRGLRLAPATTMLYRKRMLYINGEQTTLAPPHGALLRRLANDRSLPASMLGATLPPVLHDWYQAGYLLLDR